LPKRLYEEARRVLKEGETDAASFNDLLIQSLEERLQRVRRELIDREFAAMKDDAPYQRESALINQQFASNDRDTLQSTDKE
jgi:hypothetical protein